MRGALCLLLCLACAARARARAAAPLVVLATVDGGVVALDAATGARVFSLEAAGGPAVSSWAAPGEARYIPTLGGQLYRLPPEGDDLAPPEEVDAAFLTQGGGEAAVARIGGGGAAILRQTTTAVTYVDARSGRVVRKLEFGAPAVQEPVPVGGGPVVLLSRTKVGVRVVDAATGAELANASITHTTPSLLFGNLCVPAAEMDEGEEDEDEEPQSVVGGVAPALRTLVDARRGVVRMVDAASGAVHWSVSIEKDILSAHGLGNVRVVQVSDASAPHVYDDDDDAAHALVRGDAGARYAVVPARWRGRRLALSPPDAPGEEEDGEDDWDGFDARRDAAEGDKFVVTMRKNIIELMGLSVALGVIIGVVGLGAARRVRARRVGAVSSEGSAVGAVVARAGEEDAEASTGSAASAGAVPVRSGSGWMTIGSFEVSSKVLGVGSHGTVVYEGRMMPGARRIAVKRLLRQFYESARQEISLLVELDEASPHVVRYFAMEEDAEFIYLALELCNGSLADRVAAHSLPAPPKSYTRGPLPRATTKALRQLMQGLADLHRLGMVHRDLKPQNVLCQGVNLKLADVGLALRLDAGRSSYSVVGNAAGGVGTTGWRAPEVLNGMRQTRSVDLFSLGCVISFVVTGGDHPFGSEIFGRDGRIATGKPDLRSLEALQAPEALHIVERMLARIPDERPTASEALCHPFFWTDAMKLAFLVDISDRLYDLRHDGMRYTERLDESLIAVRHCSDWPSRLEPDVMREIGSGYISSASNLLRVIRNKKNHYSELSPRLHKLFGPIPEDDDMNTGTSNVDLGNLLDEQNFLTYFLRRVPQLLMCVYAHAMTYPVLVHQPHFTRYGFKVKSSTAGPSVRRSSRSRERDCSKGSSSDAEQVAVSEVRGRCYYARGKMVAASESAPPASQELVATMKESNAFCLGAGERWRYRLTTGLYDIPADEMLDDSDTEAQVPVSPKDVPVSPSPGTPAMTLHAPPGFLDTGFSLSPNHASTRFEPPPMRPIAPPGFDSLGPRRGGFGSDVTRHGPVTQPRFGSLYSSSAAGTAVPAADPHREDWGRGRPPPGRDSGTTPPGFHEPRFQQQTHQPQQPQQRTWPNRKPALGYSEPGAEDDRDWSGLRRGS